MFLSITQSFAGKILKKSNFCRILSKFFWKKAIKSGNKIRILLTGFYSLTNPAPSQGCYSKYRQTGERIVTLDLRKLIYCIFPWGIRIWGQKWQNQPGSLRVVALNEHFFMIFNNFEQFWAIFGMYLLSKR